MWSPSQWLVKSKLSCKLFLLWVYLQLHKLSEVQTRTSPSNFSLEPLQLQYHPFRASPMWKIISIIEGDKKKKKKLKQFFYISNFLLLINSNSSGLMSYCLFFKFFLLFINFIVQNLKSFDGNQKSLCQTVNILFKSRQIYCEDNVCRFPK